MKKNRFINAFIFTFFISYFLAINELFLIFRSTTPLMHFFVSYSYSILFCCLPLSVTGLVIYFLLDRLKNKQVKKYGFICIILLLLFLVFASQYDFFFIDTDYIKKPVYLKIKFESLIIIFFLVTGMVSVIFFAVKKYNNIKLIFAAFFINLSYLLTATFLTYINHRYFSSYISPAALTVNISFFTFIGITGYYLFLKINSIKISHFKIKIVMILILLLPLLSFCTLIKPGIQNITSKKNIDKNKRRLILITVDAMRYDSLNKNLPNFNILIKDSVNFTKTFSPAPWTSPSIGSMLTSRYPSDISIFSFFDSVSDNAVFISEILQDKGITTAAFISNPMLSKVFNFNQGFKDSNFYYYLEETPFYELTGWYQLYNKIHRQKKTEDLQDCNIFFNKALDWIKGHLNEDFFLWIHLYDPHTPYSPPLKFQSPAKTKSIFKTKYNFIDIAKTYYKYTNDDIERIKQLYDGEVKFVDFELGKFTSSLKDMDIYDNCYLIVSSDHGEEFWEHGGLLHGHTHYNELLHIPLIIKMPYLQNKNTIIDNTASLLDITPTICSIFNIYYTRNDFEGLNLLSPAFKNTKDRVIFSECLSRNKESKCVIKSNYKYILDYTNLSEELYNIKTDYKEKNNLISKDLKIGNELRNILKNKFISPGSKKLNRLFLNPRKIEILRTLNYL